MLDKNENIEQPIPVEWRSAIVEIVNGIQERNLVSMRVLGLTIDVSSPEIELIYQSVDSYGDSLVSLPEDAWRTSICRWMGSYWHLIIDIFTVEEGLSDLALFVDVYDHRDSVCFKILSVHVP